MQSSFWKKISSLVFGQSRASELSDLGVESEHDTVAPSKVRSLQGALKECRKGIVAVGLFSAIINFLMLVPPMYMLNTYDRVLSSGSYGTLAALTGIMIYLLVVMGLLEWVRSAVLVRISAHFDASLGDHLYGVALKQALYSSGRIQTATPISDLNGLRQFLTGNGLFAFFDAPWLPIYIFVMFLFHPLFGYAAIGASIYLAVLALLNEKLTRKPLDQANKRNAVLQTMTSKALRNVDSIMSMGMQARFVDMWRSQQDKLMIDQSLASDRGGAITAASKSSRIILQSLVLGLGAYLALSAELSPGMMIAGSILLGRALQPMDQMIAVWKQFVSARGQWARLNELLIKVPVDRAQMRLPDPVGNLVAKGAVIAIPGSKGAAVIQGVSFQLPAGSSMGIIGPSGAGKSTLLKGLLGLWPSSSGEIRLDGAEVFSWDKEHLGRFVGYLPQEIELFDGTIAENIGRFEDSNPEQVVEAATLAGVHEMILSLPEGYDTNLSIHGLSGGQKQRVGLARALYRIPRIIYLDEPNSNLDDVGEKALFGAIRELKRRGSTVIVVTHKTNILTELDNLLLLVGGKTQAFGPRDKVFEYLAQSAETKKQTQEA